MNQKSLASALLALSLVAGGAWAQTLEVIEASLPRSTTDKPALMRGLLDPAPQSNGKLLMVFPGWPGIPRIEVKDGRPSWLYLQQHVQELRLCCTGPAFP